MLKQYVIVLNFIISIMMEMVMEIKTKPKV